MPKWLSVLLYALLGISIAARFFHVDAPLDIDRPAQVLYNYHWSPAATYPHQAAFFEGLQRWAKYPEYDRIVLFGQFITL